METWSCFGNPSGRSVFQTPFDRAQGQMRSGKGRVHLIKSLNTDLFKQILSFVEIPDLYRLSEVDRDMYGLLMLRTFCDKEDCDAEICRAQPHNDRIWKDQIKRIFSGRLKKRFIKEHVEKNWQRLSSDFSDETKDLLTKYFKDSSSFNIEKELKQCTNIARVAKDIFLLSRNIQGIKKIGTFLMSSAHLAPYSYPLPFAGTAFASSEIIGLAILAQSRRNKQQDDRSITPQTSTPSLLPSKKH